jgi:hypothetical protein
MNVSTTMNGAATPINVVRQCEEDKEQGEEAPRASQAGVNAANLPTSLSMVEQAAGILRAFLETNGLADWTCFFADQLNLVAIDDNIEQLGENDSKWIPFGSFSEGGHQPARLIERQHHTKPTFHPAGFLWLKRHQVVIYRWFNFFGGDWTIHVLCAAATADRFEHLCLDIQKLNRRNGEQLWHVWSDTSSLRTAIARTSRIAWDDLVLAPSLRLRIQTEVIDFFSDPAAALYRELNIPYRRGVLLHGPPGNGKTSIIRALGALQPNISAMLLRPGARFDDNDFVELIRDWTKQAPAMLVIEDLDSILTKMKVSTLLNQIDGIDQPGGGLLLIATTNYPDELDPAINNRPGRFDVVVEVGPPTQPLRLQYFQRCSLQSLGTALMEELATTTHGLSFAQLREIEGLSGLIAVRAGRRARIPDDVREAAMIVLLSHTQASRGFPSRKTKAGFVAEQLDE